MRSAPPCPNGNAVQVARMVEALREGVADQETARVGASERAGNGSLCMGTPMPSKPLAVPVLDRCVAMSASEATVINKAVMGRGDREDPARWDMEARWGWHSARQGSLGP